MVHQIICDNNFVLPDLQMLKLLALYFSSIWKQQHFFLKYVVLVFSVVLVTCNIHAKSD